MVHPPWRSPSLVRLLAACLLLLVAVALVPATQAGTLWPTATKVGDTANSPPSCGSSPHYAFDAVAPAAGEAPLPTTSLAAACYFLMDYTATAPFTLSGTATVHLLFSCVAVATATPVDGSDTRAHLLLNGEEISSQTLFEPTSPACTPAGDNIEVTHELDTADTAVLPGDVLSVQVYYWFAQPPSEVAGTSLVIGPDGSSFVADGLPDPVAPSTDDNTTTNTTSSSTGTTPSTSSSSSSTPSPTTTSSTDSSSESSSSSSESEETSSSTAATEDKKDSPGLPLFVGLGVLAFAAIAARRRLH